MWSAFVCMCLCVFKQLVSQNQILSIAIGRQTMCYKRGVKTDFPRKYTSFVEMTFNLGCDRMFSELKACVWVL